MSPDRKKSSKRFEQLNKLTDRITKTLPSSSHVAVVLVCFRHGFQNGKFRVSTKRIAESVVLSGRRVKTILDDLERLGVIVMEEEHQGPIPRVYRITGRGANGEASDPIRKAPTPRANGEARDS